MSVFLNAQSVSTWRHITSQVGMTENDALEDLTLGRPIPGGLDQSVVLCNPHPEVYSNHRMFFIPMHLTANDVSMFDREHAEHTRLHPRMQGQCNGSPRSKECLLQHMLFYCQRVVDSFPNIPLKGWKRLRSLQWGVAGSIEEDRTILVPPPTLMAEWWNSVLDCMMTKSVQHTQYKKTFGLIGMLICTINAQEAALEVAVVDQAQLRCAYELELLKRQHLEAEVQRLKDKILETTVGSDTDLNTEMLLEYLNLPSPV
jgi:hypothetical protein